MMDQTGDHFIDPLHALVECSVLCFVNLIELFCQLDLSIQFAERSLGDVKVI